MLEKKIRRSEDYAMTFGQTQEMFSSHYAPSQIA